MQNEDANTGPLREQWWTALRELTNTAKQNKETVEIAAGCWLIPLENGLPFLGCCIAETTRRRLSYRLLFFDEKPEMHVQHPPPE